MLKCLEKDPRKRPQSAQILAEALERSLTDVVHSARRRRTRAIVLVTGTDVVAALVLRPWSWWKRGPDFQKLQAVVEEIGGTPVRPTDRMVPIPLRVEVPHALRRGGGRRDARSGAHG